MYVYFDHRAVCWDILTELQMTQCLNTCKNIRQYKLSSIFHMVDKSFGKLCPMTARIIVILITGVGKTLISYRQCGYHIGNC